MVLVGVTLDMGGGGVSVAAVLSWVSSVATGGVACPSGPFFHLAHSLACFLALSSVRSIQALFAAPDEAVK